MMQWVLLGYGALVPLLLFLLVCGDRPAFEGTWLERLHRFLFTGGCFDLLQGLIGNVFGERASSTCASLESYCCERPNPILQLFYLVVIGGSYVTVSFTSLQYIPGYYLGAWHRYAGHGAVLLAIVLFLMTSFCDPGTITIETLQQHSSVFPYDGILYGEKFCSTCKMRRPARSKHCSICNRCIARFDHHCGWMNNCIGENNIRYFLAFLIWHVCLCWYGVYLLGAIILGEVKERNVIRAVTYYYGSSVRDVYPHVLQWLLTFYSAQVLMMTFLVVVSILLACFTGYHVYLVVINTTTNETYKWDRYQRWQAELAWSKILAEASKMPAGSKSEAESNSSNNRIKCGLLHFFFRNASTVPPKPKPSFVKDNFYNRGVIANIAEVVSPLSYRTRTPPPSITKND